MFSFFRKNKRTVYYPSYKFEIINHYEENGIYFFDIKVIHNHNIEIYKRVRVGDILEVQYSIKFV